METITELEARKSYEKMVQRYIDSVNNYYSNVKPLYEDYYLKKVIRFGYGDVATVYNQIQKDLDELQGLPLGSAEAIDKMLEILDTLSVYTYTYGVGALVSEAIDLALKPEEPMDFWTYYDKLSRGVINGEE